MDGYQAGGSRGLYDIVPLSKEDRPPSGATHAVQFTASGTNTEYEVSVTLHRSLLELLSLCGDRGPAHRWSLLLAACSYTHARALQTCASERTSCQHGQSIPTTTTALNRSVSVNGKLVLFFDSARRVQRPSLTSVAFPTTLRTSVQLLHSLFFSVSGEDDDVKLTPMGKRSLERSGQWQWGAIVGKSFDSNPVTLLLQSPS